MMMGTSERASRRGRGRGQIGYMESERKEWKDGQGGRRRRNLQFTGAGAVLDLRYVRTTSKFKKKRSVRVEVRQVFESGQKRGRWPWEK